MPVPAPIPLRTDLPTWAPPDRAAWAGTYGIAPSVIPDVPPGFLAGAEREAMADLSTLSLADAIQARERMAEWEAKVARKVLHNEDAIVFYDPSDRRFYYYPLSAP